MTSLQRDNLSNAARSMFGVVQSGSVQSLRAQTLPAVAADFDGIAASTDSLRPLVQNATVTIDELYTLDASSDPAGAERTEFFCGSPVVVLTFNGLPPGMYALAILHATGVQKPQQIAIILAKSRDGRWLLAGFYSKPMLEAGHDGLWYWVSARKYAQMKMTWAAWLYYRLAADLLNPLDFLSSPNLQKLQRETEQVHPSDFPGTAPIPLNANGSAFNVTKIDTTTQFGELDVDLHYTPDPSQAAQLRSPPSARKQVTDLMAAVLALHPELRGAFHGIWVHADQENATLFALELPMDGIAAGQQQPASNAIHVAR